MGDMPNVGDASFGLVCEAEGRVSMAACLGEGTSLLEAGELCELTEMAEAGG